MRRARLYAASFLIVAVPAVMVPNSAGPDDPLAAVERALNQGRHWHATQLLRELDREALKVPEATLLAARADAGRGAWGAVVRRLAGVAWLDSLARGEGRFLLARGRLELGQFGRAATDFYAYLEYAVDREPRAMAEVGLARTLDALGRGAEAADAWGRAADIVPGFAVWSALRAAESLAASGDTAAVRQLLGAAESTPLSRRTAAAVAAYLATGDGRGAIRELTRAADSRAAGNDAADLRARAAELLLAEGDTAAARRTLREAVRRQPRGSRKAAEILAGLPGLSLDDRLDLARSFERSGAPRQAAGQYEIYLDSKPVSRSERRRLQFEIGELLFRAGANYAAIRALQTLLAQEPDRATVSRAEYIIARATYRRGWRSEGRAQLRQVADDHPGSASAIRSLALLADLYEGSGDVAKARAVYEELVEGYSGTRTARRARYRLGILTLMEGDPEQAIVYFDRVRRTGRRDKYHLGSTYWAARARESLGDSSAAEHLFRRAHARDPFGYYGLLAAERAGIDPWADLQPGPKPAPVEPEARSTLELVDFMQRAGLTEEAEAAFDQFATTRPRRAEEMLALAELMLEYGHGQDAVRMGWNAHARLRGRWSVSVLQAIYPLAYEEILVAESESRGIDPVLLAAIARQESAFTPRVVSRAGARGLLQIMPETGRWWAGRLDIRDYSRDLLFHPEISIHIGAAYFADLLRRYGELQLSLVAYNAGPTRARRWKERPAYALDPELFVERIPFTETRNYVRGVQRQLRIYRALYGGATLGRAVDFGPDPEASRQVDRPRGD
ncbi:MAG: transglycosylase SLT domain-containing protein [Gemmatimonadetes bacterium]|uniref:Transglycosylase SLT domain-containing protein n=1 Tax=Candidatus Kutchimonas denitrificans TaxID=3056748 RepID=A0AAE5CD93_9BACT|nr:transglycosylase SLT domain-containing protein [Gemmatimonadota bacterium]NIR75299.1 transglycosylase SLT domain-containing protein [Candidatus Kutchimonas denitrificans]NIS02125.1 transglycosylase SLT domain-containing protein [Gemmatimonadota bacterium]NIT67950.1 transglycosylase SLT domain-containing protein [Gemmatimonadota bacterium]NIU53944.1 transglycosylase SLT domain-containing protein [Gemmatimonadota bacterium]